GADRRPAGAHAPGADRQGGPAARRPGALVMDRLRPCRDARAQQGANPQAKIAVTLLELEHVNKRYQPERQELVALRNVSLEIDNGEVVCVSGARGSGRTTLLRVAAGIEPPDEGSVRFSGVDLRKAAESLQRQIAVCGMRFLPVHGAD